MNQVRPTPAVPANLRQRRHDRFVVETPGILRIQNTRGGIYVITVLDVSKSGLRINCSTALPYGSRVEVKCKNAKVFGEVRYTREVGYEYHVGIEADLVEAPLDAVPSAEFDLTTLFPTGPTTR